MSIVKINWLFFTVLAVAIFTLSLFPPTVKQQAAVSTHLLPAPKIEVFPVIISSFVTINDGADHIVAVSKTAREWAADEVLNHIYPALEHTPVIGNTTIPDPEQVLKLWPDIVFVNAGQADFLKKTGLPGLVEIKVNPKEPIQSREKTWQQIGAAVGKSARVEALLSRNAAKRAALKMLLPPDTAQKIRVAFIHIYGGEWWTTNSNYYIAYKLELAGAQNVTKDFKFTAKADLEQLLLTAPDMILFAANPSDHTTMREIAGHPEFQALRAVRERRIYKLPEHSYMNEPIDDPLLLTWMAEIFYPDALPRRLRDEYRETYRDVYHYTISDDEIDKAIYLEENRNSAGYDRFARQKTSQ